MLAAYDLGASAKLLQDIYDEEKGSLKPLHYENTAPKKEPHTVTITKANWTEYLGTEYDQ